MDEKELEELKKSNPKAYESYMKLKGELEEAKKMPKNDPEPKGDKDDGEAGDEDKDATLRDKIKKQKEREEERRQENRRIESALKFNLSINDFVKNNEDLLPSEIPEILKAADKEKYDSAIERANIVKSNLIQAFFAVQSNLDLLTANQKAQLDDYLKLTKNGKEQRAELIYENIFEPAIETLRKVKKAEEVGKANAGFSSGSKSENAYKEKLMAISRKTHLGEKGA